LIKASIVSHTYPTTSSPGQTVFIKQEAHLINEFANTVLHFPAVFAFPFQKQYKRSLQIDETEIPFHRFRYLSFPERKLASITQISLSRALLNSIRMQKPDLVHIHWLYPSGLAIPTLKKAGYPVILTIHGGDWYTNQLNQKLMPLLNKSLMLCDKIICVGKRLTSDISNFQPGFKNKLFHIPHGIDTGLFHPIKDTEVILKKLGWNMEKKNLLCIANLYHGKGVDLLIRAYSTISDLRKYHLHIVSPASDNETKSRIDQLINQYKLHHHITFYGSMQQTRLVNLVQVADLLISPSRKEGFGLAVAEAIACGTPVLATRSGGPEEIVNPDCGILVDTNSADSLSDGLENILKNLNRYQADTMHHYIKTNFSIESKKKKLLAVYRNILS